MNKTFFRFDSGEYVLGIYRAFGEGEFTGADVTKQGLASTHNHRWFIARGIFNIIRRHEKTRLKVYTLSPRSIRVCSEEVARLALVDKFTMPKPGDVTTRIPLSQAIEEATPRTDKQIWRREYYLTNAPRLKAESRARYAKRKAQEAR